MYMYIYVHVQEGGLHCACAFRVNNKKSKVCAINNFNAFRHRQINMRKILRQINIRQINSSGCWNSDVGLWMSPQGWGSGGREAPESEDQGCDDCTDQKGTPEVGIMYRFDNTPPCN